MVMVEMEKGEVEKVVMVVKDLRIRKEATIAKQIPINSILQSQARRTGIKTLQRKHPIAKRQTRILLRMETVNRQEWVTGGMEDLEMILIISEKIFQANQEKIILYMVQVFFANSIQDNAAVENEALPNLYA